MASFFYYESFLGLLVKWKRQHGGLILKNLKYIPFFCVLNTDYPCFIRNNFQSNAKKSVTSRCRGATALVHEGLAREQVQIQSREEREVDDIAQNGEDKGELVEGEVDAEEVADALVDRDGRVVDQRWVIAI